MNEQPFPGHGVQRCPGASSTVGQGKDGSSQVKHIVWTSPPLELLCALEVMSMPPTPLLDELLADDPFAPVPLAVDPAAPAPPAPPDLPSGSLITSPPQDGPTASTTSHAQKRAVRCIAYLLGQSTPSGRVKSIAGLDRANRRLR